MILDSQDGPVSILTTWQVGQQRKSGLFLCGKSLSLLPTQCTIRWYV